MEADTKFKCEKALKCQEDQFKQMLTLFLLHFAIQIWFLNLY